MTSKGIQIKEALILHEHEKYTRKRCIQVSKLRVERETIATDLIWENTVLNVKKDQLTAEICAIDIERGNLLDKIEGVYKANSMYEFGSNTCGNLLHPSLVKMDEAFLKKKGEILEG